VGYAESLDSCYLLIFQRKETDELCLRRSQDNDNEVVGTCGTLASLHLVWAQSAAAFFDWKKAVCFE